MGFRAAVSGIPRRRKWDSAPHRPQVANKRVSVFAKITGIGAKEDKKDLQATRADHRRCRPVAQGAPCGHRVGMLDGMPRCAVPCGIGSARKEYERGPDVQGKAGSGNGTIYK